MDKDDEGSVEAEAGYGWTASDEELLGEIAVASLSDDDDDLSDEDMRSTKAEAEVARGAARPRPSLPSRRGAANKRRQQTSGSLVSQETFLLEHEQYLHALMDHNLAVPVADLARCLQCANNLYNHMIKFCKVETDDDTVLMYDSLFQPFMREVLPRVVQKLVNDEGQVQLCGAHNAANIRSVCCDCIRLVAKLLHLHVNVLQGRELVPVINHRVGEDMLGLLRTLGELLDSPLLLRSPIFSSTPPSTAAGWDGSGLGSWAQPPAPQQAAAKPASEVGGSGDARAGVAATEGATQGSSGEIGRAHV